MSEKWQWHRGTLSEEQLRIIRKLPNTEPHAIWINGLYEVWIRYQKCSDEYTIAWLSIKSRDKTARHDWRHFQRIKNDLLGTEIEAVELYPAESRCVDGANQYHLWALIGTKTPYRFPFGFTERMTESDPPPADPELAAQAAMAKQRPREE